MQNIKIKSIRKLDKKLDRYDLTVNSTHNFFANGILIHNTSFRVGHVLTNKRLKWHEKILKAFSVDINVKQWEYLNGTRRVVIEESTGKQFHDPTIREKAFKLFKGNLRKGETVYGEIVGFESTGAHIMAPVDTTKMNDKHFTSKYGDVMSYSYGCSPNECDFYIYRITMTNEDGHTIDYTWDDVVKRCNELGVKHVPFIRKLTFEELSHEVKKLSEVNTDEDVEIQDHFIKIVEEYAKGPSVVDPRHIKEGCTIRIEGGLKPQIYKFKSHCFKVLEGIVKDSGAVDIEEAS